MNQVTVIIPNFQKYPLKKNLPQIIKNSPEAQIIVVDDASPDKAGDFFKQKYPQIKVIQNSKNLRFAQTVNLGVKAAKTPIVVLLNSDVSPKKNYLQPLIAHFKNPEVFAVSCLEIEKKNQKLVYSGKNKCQFKRGFLIHQKSKIKSFKKPQPNCWAFGGSMAVDKKKFFNLNGFDPLYSPAYWEDIDLSYRARQKGWLVLFEPRSQVFHRHETTNLKVLGKRKMQITAFRNQFLFVWKNIRGQQLLQHFLWLPYHLVFTTIKTRGIFFTSFLQALTTFKKVQPFGK